MLGKNWPPGANHQIASCLISAINRLSRCGSVRGWPVVSSHFSPGAAPQVGQRIASIFVGPNFFFIEMVGNHISQEPESDGQYRSYTIAHNTRLKVLRGLRMTDASARARLRFAHADSRRIGINREVILSR
jgi:hypothetical protein